MKGAADDTEERTVCHVSRANLSGLFCWPSVPRLACVSLRFRTAKTARRAVILQEGSDINRESKIINVNEKDIGTTVYTQYTGSR